MSAGSGGAGALVGTGLRGLRSRLLLSLGSILLAAISVGAAVVGPAYQSGAAASYLVTRLRSEPNFITGLQFTYAPNQVGPSAPRAAQVAARREADRLLNDQFERAALTLWSAPINSPTLGGQTRLLSTAGACAHLAVVGRCPAQPGEALILRHDSMYAQVEIGETVDVGLPTPLRIVGTYAPRRQDGRFWFDLTDFTSQPPVPEILQPYLSAPLIVPADTFAELPPGSWSIRAARRLVVTAHTSAADLQQAARAVAALRAKEAAGDLDLSDLRTVPGNQLVAIAHEIQRRSSTARSTVAPAVISVILVAFVLLLRLLAAAMELRRSELGLASLRGFSRRQMWLLGLVEPALILLAATPLGLLAGYLCARVLARAWLVPGLPVTLGGASVLSVVAVVVASAGVAGLVVREALGETLATQIAGVRRPGRSGRWSLLLRLVIVAAAVTVLGATLAASRRSSPSATDLALPILLAVAAGLLTALAAQALARLWASWTAARLGVFGFLASRTISRRREGTLVILPLTAALAVSIFAAGVFTAAADWRASDAATIVGAEVSYPTKLTMGQAVALTHQIDPAGRWLMAAGSEFDGTNQILVMDTPRLPRVGSWPDSWTPGFTAGDIAQRLSPTRPGVVVSGSRLTMTVDNRVSGDFATLSLELMMSHADGSPANVVLGPFRRGVSTSGARVSGCVSGCLVTQLVFGGPAAVTEAMSGSATVTSVRADAKPVPGFLRGSWRAAAPQLDSPSAVAGQPRWGGRLTVRFHAANDSAVAAVTPGDVPLVRPMLLGRTAPLAGTASPGHPLRMRASAYRSIAIDPVTQAESMPVLGPIGMLFDYTMLTRDVPIIDPSTDVTILARGDTPSSVVSALGSNGISQPVTLSTTRRVLDSDAFALALNLYLVVTVIVVVLALAGLGANLAVQMPARRRDAASLRVVGLRRRSIVAAVVAEFVVVLGAAAVAGIIAGSTAQYVVVRTVTLGYADTEHTPRLFASLNLGAVTDLLVVVTVGLFLVATAVAALTVRGARTATLRENAR